ncbi:MAG: pitrilysin family protein [Candidatus Sericytochromatia bacterium]|nr:pitrilysin family protein [Candidatus Sericytochromatia bacterium]
MQDAPVSKVTLPNGVRVLLDWMPQARSAAIGFWLDTGSCDEPAGLEGACHFLEHMLFKGTARRSALQIAQALEVTGGSLNAFTDKEHTCFHARVPAEDVPEALDVLADMLVASVLDPGELRREKAVVIEEIKMYEDTPDDLAQELTYAKFWPTHALGRPVTGTAASVRQLSRRKLQDFMAQHYTANRLVVAISGQFERDRTLAQLAQALQALPAVGVPKLSPELVSQGGRTLRYRDVEQAQLVVAAPALAITDPDRYTLAVLNAVVGGGMSSRLFQEVREKRGLVYAIGSGESLFRAGGLFAINAGMSPKHLPTVLGLIRETFDQLAQGEVGEAELQQAQRQLKGSLKLALEVPRHRMMRVAQDELYFGRELGMDEMLAAIDAVTPAAVAAMAARLLGPEGLHTTVVGPLRRWPAGLAA